MGLTGAQRQPYRQTIAIDHRMDFACQAAAGPSHRLALVSCDASSMLMYPDNGGIDHLDSGIVECGKRVYDAAPDTGPPPADETVVAGRVRAKTIRQIAHGAPDRKTQKMPLRTRRSFTRGTPRGLFGSIGLMASHSLSASS